jgi:hypothetical protein
VIVAARFGVNGIAVVIVALGILCARLSRLTRPADAV